MILKQGNMWDGPETLRVVTTCGVISRGELIMGAGAALQAKQRFPQAPREFGNFIRYMYRRESDTAHVYGFCKNYYLGIFQTKYHWRDPSDLALIGYSVVKLSRWLDNNSNVTVGMNFPGTGRGGLDMSAVTSVIESLPDSVTVYYI